MKVKLKDVGTIITGKTPSTKNQKYWNGDICFVTIEDIHTNKNIKSTQRTITKDGFDVLGKNVISGISILVNCVGDIGVVGITELTCATNQQINSITRIKKEYNPYFIYFILQTMKQEMVSLSGQTVLRILPKSVFENIEIDLPDRKQQDKVVEILSGIDDQIERNNMIVRRLQDLGNTIYSRNAKQQTITFNIQDICKPIWGNCPAGKHILDNKNNNTMPYASGAGDINNSISVNPKAFTDKPTRVVKQNDVCVSVAGTVGKIAIATEDICIGRAMLGLSNSKLYGYIYFGINSYASVLQKQATGAIQKIINNDHLSIVNMPIYTDEITKKLNLIVDQMIKIDMNTKELISLKEKLLPLLINGQLSI